MLHKEDLIDVPDDFYDEDILFTDPNQLMEMFSDLEEANLDNIRKTQDIEEALEITRQQEIRKR